MDLQHIMDTYQWQPSFAQWVVKISKHCNLRCRYCYEYPFLGDEAKMELDQIEAMFLNIADHYKHHPMRMDFVWHGGEPLLIKLDYYRKIFKLQEEIFTPHKIPYTNSVQTNLTILNDDIIAAFKNGEFKHIGVSIDLYGDDRVNIAGKPIEPKVLKNMQRLKDEGINFGCIMVLSQKTLPHIEKICDFFDEIDTSFRMLPIYRTGYEGQHNDNAVSPLEIVDAFKRVFDWWLASESYIQARPVQDYITNVVRKINQDNIVPRHYCKPLGEVVYIIDTDGGLYSNADAYAPHLCYGNVFEQSLTATLNSKGYQNAVENAASRVLATCEDCHYFGACSGYFMGEATPEQRWFGKDGFLECAVVKPMQDYILWRLSEAGLIEQLSKSMENVIHEMEPDIVG